MPRLPSFSREAASVAALLAICARLIAVASRARDLPNDDEALYFAWGVRVASVMKAGAPFPKPPADWGPLYVSFYALVASLVDDPARVYDVAWGTLVIGTTLAAYALARASGARPAIAIGCTAVLTATSFFHVLPYPCHLATLVLLVTAILARRAGSFAERAPVLLAGASIAAFVRPEYTAPAALLAIVHVALSVRAWRRGEAFTNKRVALALAAFAPFGVLAAVFGDPLAGSRSFVAFSQHYAFGVTRREHLPGNPWLNYAALTSRDFGDASTVGAAFVRNPRTMFVHITHNAIELPSNVVDLLALRPRLPDDPSLLMQGLGGAIAGVGLVLVVLGLRRAWRARMTPGSEAAAREGAFVAFLAALPGCLLVFPRAHYLMTTTAFASVLASVELERRLAGSRVAARAGRLFLPAAVLVIALLLPRPGSLRPQPTRDAVRALRELHLPQATALDLGCLARYAGYDFAEVDIWKKDLPLFEYLERHDIGVFVVWFPFLARAEWADDPEVAAFLRAPDAHGFCTAYEGAPLYRVIVRRSLAPSACR